MTFYQLSFQTNFFEKAVTLTITTLYPCVFLKLTFKTEAFKLNTTFK